MVLGLTKTKKNNKIKDLMEIMMAENDSENLKATEPKAKGKKQNKKVPETEAKKEEAQPGQEKELSEEEQEMRLILKTMEDQGLMMADERAVIFIQGFMKAHRNFVNTRGRPTKYDELLCDWVEYLGGRGYSLTQIAFTFGVSRETLYDWARKYPDFSDALARARDAAQNWWEMIGQSALFSDRFQFGVWNKVVSTRFRKDYTDRKGLPYDPNESETVMGPGEVLELDPRDLTEEQKKILRIAIAKAKPQES